MFSADVLGVKKGVAQLKRVNANYPNRQMSLHGGVRRRVPAFHLRWCIRFMLLPLLNQIKQDLQ